MPSINKFEDENQWKITQSPVGEYGSDSTKVYCNDTEIKAVELKVEWGDFSDYAHTLNLTIKIPKRNLEVCNAIPTIEKATEEQKLVDDFKCAVILKKNLNGAYLTGAEALAYLTGVHTIGIDLNKVTVDEK